MLQPCPGVRKVGLKSAFASQSLLTPVMVWEAGALHCHEEEPACIASHSICPTIPITRALSSRASSQAQPFPLYPYPGAIISKAGILGNPLPRCQDGEEVYVLSDKLETIGACEQYQLRASGMQVAQDLRTQ